MKDKQSECPLFYLWENPVKQNYFMLQRIYVTKKQEETFEITTKSAIINQK